VEIKCRQHSTGLVGFDVALLAYGEDEKFEIAVIDDIHNPDSELRDIDGEFDSIRVGIDYHNEGE
jgi:hypothetical protein